MPDFTESTALKKLADASKDAFRQMSAAADKYKDSLEDAAQAREKLAGIEKQYQRELSTMNLRDVGGLKSLMRRHQWDKEDQAANVATAEMAVTNARAAYTTSATGAAQAAAKYGDVIVNIGNREIAKVIGAAAGDTNRSHGIGVN